MRRVRGLEYHDWLLLPLVVVCFGGAIWMSVIAVDSYRAEHGGLAGDVTIEDCVFADTDDGPEWTCSGPFVSADGAVRIDAVTLHDRFRAPLEDGTTVAGTVSGPSADTLYTDDQLWWWLAGVAVAFLGIGIHFLRPILRGGTDVVTPPTVDPAHAAVADQSRSLPAEWDDVPPPSAREVTAAGAPTAAGPKRANLVIWKVLAGWLLLGSTIAGTLWYLAEWERQQDAPLTASALGTVTATRLGADDRIEVAYHDDAGDEWRVRWRPRDADSYREGGQVPLRYDPTRPDEVMPEYPEFFEFEPPQRIVFAHIALLPGFVLAWAWTWRLGRWTLGTLRRGRPAQASVRVAELHWGTEPTSYWLELRSEDRTWYQRVVWDSRLVHWLHRNPWSAERLPSSVELRRCPGFRRMYLVDVAGVGRLWPASTARSRPPINYELSPVELSSLGFTEPASRHLKMLLALAALAGGGWLLAGPPGAAYLLALIGGYQLWGGGAPWRGFYAVRP
ncbi:hypothetical protein E0H26_00095 [Micromonospora zingiberis]|uniref:DUF3592 domain-containing protein n=1 Tax=Micromonospora zingiberis TaxID=2053011 RepID=A0A4R0GRC9_9ACTN|nr:DUF3592 domain-containing protein [Micromonospora zingiberis]TCC00151.1 hypothetical protein E0H26_00095 [Micromonospora zingiberis]